MSWLYSQALVAAFSEATCSDGEPSAPSSGSPTPQAYSSPDRTTAASRLSRYGMTCEPLTASRGAELLTWFRADFPAKTSALQGKARASTAPSQECGTTWRGWWAKYDPASSLWRTPQCSFIADLDESSATLPSSGTTRDGMLWGLPTLEHHTSETVSGLWPTPVADDTNSRTTKYAQGGTALSLAVKLWPTPTVCGNYNRKGASATSGDGLATAVKQYATPVARMWKDNGLSPSELARNSETLATQAGGPLNPPWVEWLMGWPEGWTDLKPLEMGKFHEWQQQHSLPSAMSEAA